MRTSVITMAALAACLLDGCVAVPEEYLALQSRRQTALDAPFKGLDPGYKTEETVHFKLSAYDSASAARYAALCEENYSRIMQDLGIYSFVPSRPYNVTVYRNAAEYHEKTGQPEWSGGAAYGNALLLYEGSGLAPTVAHEMTHLVFNEFMGLSQAAELRWLNEGVAVYEETRSDGRAEASYINRVNSQVAPNPIPFSQMVNLAPQTESLKNVDRWYAQAGSVAGFMIRRGGSFNFSVFLGKLRDGYAMDQAVSGSFTSGWNTLADVERAWLLEIKR